MLKMKESVLKNIGHYKYPFMILALGILLMLIPFESGESRNIETDSESALLSHILSNARDIGKAEVLISDNGVVVVCQGAESAKTRLEIISAVTSYTGYGSDRITILKMADQA